MDTYTFKAVPEIVWAVAVAVVVALAQILSGLSVDQILGDPQAVAAIIGAAVARAALAAVWNGINKLTDQVE